MKDENKIEAYGNVEVISNNNVTLKTEQLIWDHSNQEVVSKSSVTVIKSNGDVLVGKGFESDYLFKKWTIKNVSKQ